MAEKRKADKGPEPPKRPQSGYGQFLSEKRTEITATLTAEGVLSAKLMTATAKRAGEMWKAMGEGEQAPFNAKSKKLSEAYVKELEAFNADNPDFKKVKKLKKGHKDKPPSRPLGPYAMWIADNRPMLTEKLMKQHGVDRAKAFLMLYKEARPLYDALPAAEKKHCAEKTEAAKVKYQVDFKEWKESHKGDPKEKRVKVGGPKRPLGAYAQWVSENRLMLTQKIMKDHSVDKQKAFLMCYKEGKPVYDALPPAEKKKCEDKADAAKAKYQVESKEWKTGKPAKADEGAAEAEDLDSEEGEEDAEGEEDEEEAE